MNWLDSVDEGEWERSVALRNLVAALEASQIDTGLTLLGRALEMVETELNSESTVVPLTDSYEERSVLLLVVRMRALLARLGRHRTDLVLELCKLAGREGERPAAPPTAIPSPRPEPLEGYTWD